MADQFRFIRKTDKKNLDEITGSLELAGFDVRLAGSARYDPQYQDIDLVLSHPAVVDKTPETMMHAALGALGIKDMKKYESLAPGYWYADAPIDARCEFEYKGTKFDLSCETPRFTGDQHHINPPQYRINPPQPPLGGGSSGGPGTGNM